MGNYHSPGEWRHLVHYQVAESGTGGHFVMVRGFSSFHVKCECKPFWRWWEDSVPSMSDVSASLSSDGEMIQFLPCQM